jgi:hypothetical protein
MFPGFKRSFCPSLLCRNSNPNTTIKEKKEEGEEEEGGAGRRGRGGGGGEEGEEEEPIPPSARGEGRGARRSMGEAGEEFQSESEVGA